MASLAKAVAAMRARPPELAVGASEGPAAKPRFESQSSSPKDGTKSPAEGYPRYATEDDEGAKGIPALRSRLAAKSIAFKFGLKRLAEKVPPILTKRCEATVEACLLRAEDCGGMCVVSFPGHHIDEWHLLSRLCKDGHLSTACVFMSQQDPVRRYGSHAENDETPGQCYCHSLYGGEKDWGCAWFQAWMGNIEEARRLGLQLVVIFLPQQRKLGVVKWHLLNREGNNLWNKVGLGGSQKGEVAWLQKQGYTFMSMDVEQCITCFGASDETVEKTGKTARQKRRAVAGVAKDVHNAIEDVQALLDGLNDMEIGAESLFAPADDLRNCSCTFRAAALTLSQGRGDGHAICAAAAKEATRFMKFLKLFAKFASEIQERCGMDCTTPLQEHILLAERNAQRLKRLDALVDVPTVQDMSSQATGSEDASPPGSAKPPGTAESGRRQLHLPRDAVPSRGERRGGEETAGPSAGQPLTPGGGARRSQLVPPDSTQHMRSGLNSAETGLWSMAGLAGTPMSMSEPDESDVEDDMSPMSAREKSPKSGERRRRRTSFFKSVTRVHQFLAIGREEDGGEAKAAERPMAPEASSPMSSRSPISPQSAPEESGTPDERRLRAMRRLERRRQRQASRQRRREEFEEFLQKKGGREGSRLPEVLPDSPRSQMVQPVGSESGPLWMWPGVVYARSLPRELSPRAPRPFGGRIQVARGRPKQDDLPLLPLVALR